MIGCRLGHVEERPTTRTPVARLLVAVVLSGLFAAGCDQGAIPTEPLVDAEIVNIEPIAVSNPQTTPVTSVPQMRPYPGTRVAGEVSVCKDASSPAGAYTFTVSAANAQEGDMVTSSVTLAPGQCSIVYNRVIRRFSNSRVANITITEVIPGGATYRLDRVFTDDDLTGSRTVAGPSVTVGANAHHGGYANFFNVANSTHPAPPPPPPAHPPAGTGQIQVCKAGSGTGTFTVTGVIGTTIGSDVISNNGVSLTAGSCATVFTRIAAAPVAASVTIKESVSPGLFLSGVTVNGTATASLGGAVIVTQQNDLALKTVAFTNASVNLGAELPFTTTPTAGQVRLCKHPGVTGTFNFNVAVAGAVATDQIVNAVSLRANTCKVIFVRAATVAGSGAVITVTELNAAGFVVSSTRYTGAAGGVVTPGVTAVATENFITGGSVIVFTNLAVTVPPVIVPPLVDLGAASSSAILAGTTVTCVTGGVVNGGISISPGTALTGFGGPCVATGALNLGNPSAALAQVSLTAAYNALAALPCPPANLLVADLGGTTKAAGVYCSASSIGLTGTLTLDGGGDPNATFVFQAGSTLTTAGNVVLINGAQAKNVFFQVGSSATIGTGSQIQGNILAQASISLLNSATLNGRALARTGAVTLGSNNVILLP